MEIKKVYQEVDQNENKLDLRNYSNFIKEEKKKLLNEYVEDIVRILLEKQLDKSIEKYNQRLTLEQINDTLKLVQDKLNKCNLWYPHRSYED